MKTAKSSISKASSYVEMGEYWDQHDLVDCWERTKDASFEFAEEPQINYFAVERSLSEKLRSLATQRGVSADTLVNMWIQEKVSS
jgi:hypothetical protein